MAKESKDKKSDKKPNRSDRYNWDEDQITIIKPKEEKETKDKDEKDKESDDD